jgi:hypothetical protein
MRRGDSNRRGANVDGGQGKRGRTFRHRHEGLVHHAPGRDFSGSSRQPRDEHYAIGGSVSER